MNALKISSTLNTIEKTMHELAPYRRPELFNEFLVRGYSAVTLSSVPKEKFSDLLRAKLCMGTLITLYDDFADRPSQSHPKVLEILYQIDFEKSYPVRISDSRSMQVFDFASSLFSQMKSVLEQLPHYDKLKEILHFDLMQFYSANQYSSLLTAHSFINNSLENRLYTHHNMGMVIVAMMDIMATPKINFSEFAAIREVFLLGQRMGRICNVITTYKRETLDGDIAGELAIYKSEYDISKAIQELRQEIIVIQSKILSFESKITTFSVSDYLEGLKSVQKLHEKMEGRI